MIEKKDEKYEEMRDNKQGGQNSKREESKGKIVKKDEK
jgi:hypothetical protein